MGRAAVQDHIEQCEAFTHLQHGKDVELVFYDKVTFFMDVMAEQKKHWVGKSLKIDVFPSA